MILKFKNRIKGYEHLEVTQSGIIKNTKTGRLKKLCLNGYSKGIWVTNNKFLTNPKKYLEPIPKNEHCPFSNGTIRIN